MANFLIIGGSGYIGKNLCRSLLDDGHLVTVKTRSNANTINQFEKFGYTPKVIEMYEQLSAENLPDYVISLAGAGIVDKRWSNTRKQELINSRVQPLVELKNFLEVNQHKPKRILLGSAIGYYGYGKDPEATFHERSLYTQGFVHKICAETEKQADSLSELTDHVISLRTGVVLSPDGGALKKMLAPAKFHLNGKIGNGRQWVSWIHINDWVNACKHILNNTNPKPAYNLTAPEAARNSKLSKAIGDSMNKPFQMAVPAFALKMLLGESSILLTEGQKVLPKNLLDEGFVFEVNSIEIAVGLVS